MRRGAVSQVHLRSNRMLLRSLVVVYSRPVRQQGSVYSSFYCSQNFLVCDKIRRVLNTHVLHTTLSTLHVSALTLQRNTECTYYKTTAWQYLRLICSRIKLSCAAVTTAGNHLLMWFTDLVVVMLRSQIPRNTICWTIKEKVYRFSGHISRRNGT